MRLTKEQLDAVEASGLVAPEAARLMALEIRSLRKRLKKTRKGLLALYDRLTEELQAADAVSAARKDGVNG